MTDGYIDIFGYEGRYKINRDGIIVSSKTGNVLKTQIQNSGYELAHLHIRGKRTAETVHRLVAEHFLENPNKKPQVNHKDGNKRNNAADNLEWSTQSENMKHAFSSGLLDFTIESKRANGRALGKKYGGKYTDKVMERNRLNMKPVIQFDMIGNEVAVFESIKAASRAGFRNVNKVIRGEYSQCGGYKWALLNR